MNTVHFLHEKVSMFIAYRLNLQRRFQIHKIRGVESVFFELNLINL